ncbi:MarR family winged helix-turn-helix transcriptional regulator [Parasphingorhabdus sp.]|uniref:MarR family winged helix-turn-helix transcriptional regulator n=1 Tax=Parasphingorhabdus sp. TaxID=2709688 RepID=UPI003D26CF98
METATATLIERLARMLQNESHSSGLKPTQWEILRFIGRANRFSRNPGSVVSYLGLTKGTVSQTLNALVGKGLVQKTVSTADKRAVMLNLTEKGLQLLADDPIREVEKGIEQLSSEDQDAVSSGIEKLVRTMLKERTSRAFGACNSCTYFLRNHESGEPHLCRLLNETLSEDDGQRICIEQIDHT